MDFSLLVVLRLSCPAAALRGNLGAPALEGTAPQGSPKDILFLNVPFSSSLELLSLHTGTTTCGLGDSNAALGYGSISETSLVPLPPLCVTLHLV